MEDFEIINHTADIGIIAHGTDLKGMFTNAARAMFDLITDLEKIDEIICYNIEASGENWEDLLVAWLNELLYLFDTQTVIFKRFEVTDLTCIRLKAKGYGEKIDLSRHKLKMGIKATTYHMLKIEKDNGFKAHVLFDV